MRILKKALFVTSLIATNYFAFNVNAASLGLSQNLDGENPWMIRTRALYIAPQVSAESAGEFADIHITKNLTPEFDVSYFFTKNIALELILATTKHNVSSGNLDFGSIYLLPPTLSIQYHLDFAGFKPYAGVGLNYTIFYQSIKSPATEVEIEYKNKFGYSLQLGFDYMFTKNLGVNVDVKKLFLKTKANDVIDVKINPLIVGVGLTYKF